MTEFPSVQDIVLQLKYELDYIQSTYQEEDLVDGDFAGVDVRLQVYPDGAWAVHTGPSDYDQDHRGYWGASCLSYHDTPANLVDLARDLINQAEDMEGSGK